MNTYTYSRVANGYAVKVNYPGGGSTSFNVNSYGQRSAGPTSVFESWRNAGRPGWIGFAQGTMATVTVNNYGSVVSGLSVNQNGAGATGGGADGAPNGGGGSAGFFSSLITSAADAFNHVVTNVTDYGSDLVSSLGPNVLNSSESLSFTQQEQLRRAEILRLQQKQSTGGGNSTMMIAAIALGAVLLISSKK